MQAFTTSTAATMPGTATTATSAADSKYQQLTTSQINLKKHFPKGTHGFPNCALRNGLFARVVPKNPGGCFLQIYGLYNGKEKIYREKGFAITTHTSLWELPNNQILVVCERVSYIVNTQDLETCEKFVGDSMYDGIGRKLLNLQIFDDSRVLLQFDGYSQLLLVAVGKLRVALKRYEDMDSQDISGDAEAIVNFIFANNIIASLDLGVIVGDIMPRFAVSFSRAVVVINDRELSVHRFDDGDAKQAATKTFVCLGNTKLIERPTDICFAGMRDEVVVAYPGGTETDEVIPLEMRSVPSLVISATHSIKNAGTAFKVLYSLRSQDGVIVGRSSGRLDYDPTSSGLRTAGVEMYHGTTPSQHIIFFDITTREVTVATHNIYPGDLFEPLSVSSDGGVAVASYDPENIGSFSPAGVYVHAYYSRAYIERFIQTIRDCLIIDDGRTQLLLPPLIKIVAEYVWALERDLGNSNSICVTSNIGKLGGPAHVGNAAAETASTTTAVAVNTVAVVPPNNTAAPPSP